jgi:hypothetical protein
LPVDQLSDQVDRAVTRLAALDPQAVQQSRRRLQLAAGEQLDALMQAEMDLFESLLGGEAAQRALKAFVSR